MKEGLKQRIRFNIKGVEIVEGRTEYGIIQRTDVLTELSKTIAEIKYKIKKLRAVIKVAKAYPRDARDKIDAEVWEAEIEIYNDVLKDLDSERKEIKKLNENKYPPTMVPSRGTMSARAR